MPYVVSQSSSWTVYNSIGMQKANDDMGMLWVVQLYCLALEIFTFYLWSRILMRAFFMRNTHHKEVLYLAAQLCIKVSGGRDFAKINEGHQNSQMFSRN